MRRQKYFIGLWLDKEEYHHLQTQCSISGLTVSSLIRKLIAGAKLRPRPPDQYATLLRELSAIGNNINQIAHWANARKSANESEIANAAALARKAWELVKNGL